MSAAMIRDAEGDGGSRIEDAPTNDSREAFFGRGRPCGDESPRTGSRDRRERVYACRSKSYNVAIKR